MFSLNNLLSSTLANFAEVTPIPEALLDHKFIMWNHDIKESIDWDDFIAGQKVMHLEYNQDNAVFDGRIMLNSLSQGNSANTFQGMWKLNETITILVKDHIEFNSNLITLGKDTSKMYFAASYPIRETIEGKEYLSKVVLQDIQAFLNNNFEDSTQGYYQNIRIGKYGQTVKVPKELFDKFDKLIDYEAEDLVVETPKYLEIMLPEPNHLLGIDAIDTDETKWKEPKYSVAPHTFSKNEYSIQPIQFNIFAIDNYGVAHPNDMTNAIKALSFTAQLGSVISSSGTAASSLGNNNIATGSSLISMGISGASKFIGDARHLSSETAISTRFLEDENNLIKMFIQPDTNIDSFLATDINSSTDKYQTLQNTNTIVNIQGLVKSGSALPNSDLLVSIVGKGGNNVGSGTKYNIVGGQSLKNLMGGSQYKANIKVPFLKAPYATGAFKITNADIQDYLSIGVPRLNVDRGNKISPVQESRTWTLQLRWNGFRPDPYSWMNWPVLSPVQMGIYDVINKGISVGYNKNIKENEDSTGTANSGYWSKGMTVADITNKRFPNPNKIFTSLSMDLTDVVNGPDVNKVLDMLDISAITSSPLIVRIYAKEEDARLGQAPINEFRFRSQGQRVGTSAAFNTRLYL